MTAAPGPRSRRPRAAANYGPQRGTTYLIHFARPFKHALHYKGWTERPVEERFADHVAGRGALLTRLVVQAGIPMTLARVWPDTTRDREDAIKRSAGKEMCPECGVKPGRTRLASDKPPEAPDRRPMWMADRDGQWDDGTPIIFDPDQTWEQARAIRAAMQIPEPDPAGQAELAALDELQRQWTNQEEQVGLRNAIARGAAAMRGQREAHQRRAANREADRLWAIADELDKQMGRRPGYQHELTAERAARIRARLGEDLARDAHIAAMPQAEGQPLEHWAITPDDVAPLAPAGGPVLQGGELDAEIGRLAEAFPEPDSEPEEVALWEEALWEEHHRETAGEPGEDAATWSPAPARGEPAGQPAAEQPGEAEQFADWQPDLSAEEMQAFEQAERERWAQVDRDTEYMARQAAQYYGPEMADLLGIEPGDAGQVPDSPGWEFGDDVARAAPGLQAERLGEELQEHADRAAHLQRLESRANARQGIAHAAGDAATAAAARQQAQRLRADRLAAEAEAYDTAAALQEDAAQAEREPGESAARRSPELAPTAAVQPAGTPHTDPALAERGWQADSHGVYARNPDAEAPGAHCGLGGYEADSPDHMYGSPQCAEADPEGAHFGRGPGEPMDTGRWPVLQADYGRMYIGPQAQAEAS
jgi:hypothetical protein